MVHQRGSHPTFGIPPGDSLWAFLAAHTTAADQRHAVHVLATDSVRWHRVTAALILTNFGMVDETWHVLVHTLRDPDPVVAGIASNVLRRMPLLHTRVVDWTPAASDLRMVLAGGFLDDLPSFMAMLSQTGISPALAPPLLRDNGRYVLGYLGVRGVPDVSGPAYALLKQLSTKDYGADRAAWEAWIRSLGSS